jgi:hypothetical protein
MVNGMMKIGYYVNNKREVFKIKEMSKKAVGVAIRDNYKIIKVSARQLNMLHERLFVLRNEESHKEIPRTNSPRKILKATGLSRQIIKREMRQMDIEDGNSGRIERLEQILDLAILQLESGADPELILKVLKQTRGGEK